METTTTEVKSERIPDGLVSDLMAGDEAGRRYALGIKPGDVFLGCSPAAMAAGFQRDTPGYRMFLHSSLDVVKSMSIRTDSANVVTSCIERRGCQ